MRNNKITLFIAVIVFLIAATAFAVTVSLFLNDKEEDQNPKQTSEQPETSSEEDAAIQAGRTLSSGKCNGTGPTDLTHLPMDEADFSILIPYGLMIGAHVTPIDHQYFSPTVFHSPRDTYNVYAPADGMITEIGARARTNPDDPNDKFEEYRIVFTYSCTFFSYYDLVTSLSPGLKIEYDKAKNSSGYASGMQYPVKSGDIIGKIGGQTLDFAVWDTTKPLSGFVVPEHYTKAELWKIYTANPYDYFTKEINEILLAKNPRTVEPIQGKIDYDIDGKLVGNWFVKDTNGYGGNSGTAGEGYWTTHFSLSPDHYDPTGIIISFGDFQGEAKQFLITNKEFDPSTIEVSSGLQKLEFQQFSYLDPNGKMWDQMGIIKGPRVVENAQETVHCAFIEMTGDREMKLETFAGKKCSQVSGFTSSVVVYER